VYNDLCCQVANSAQRKVVYDVNVNVDVNHKFLAWLK